MLGIIGGTGLGSLSNLQDVTAEQVASEFGSAYVERGNIESTPVVFLPRHGNPAKNLPHLVNYRANIRALQQLGVTEVIAVTAVGSVDPQLEVADLVVPDQIIDYTSGREHTFFAADIHHVDFTYPYTPELRTRLLDVIRQELTEHYVDGGVYGCTNGPRLETAAEIQRMFRDGCTIVGMTAMPEAVLAREAELAYAGMSVVVNKGAGLAGALDLDEIDASLHQSMAKVAGVLRRFAQES
jgi:5'-deoxy-5'-methylthioadenosine phosphorylase